MILYSKLIGRFFIEDNKERNRFFEENFLLTNIGIKIILGILFSSSSHSNVKIKGRLTNEPT